MSQEHEKLNESFSTLLKLERERIGLTQTVLANIVGIDVSYLSRIENGKRNPPKRSTVVSMCFALGMDESGANKLLLSSGYHALFKEETTSSGFPISDSKTVTPEASKLIAQTAAAIIAVIDDLETNPAERATLIEILSRVPNMIRAMKPSK